MRARYPWTHQLDYILCLVKEIPDRDVTPKDRLEMLEILGGLEMNAWIVGRQSQALHIWATYCCGGDGIEPFTGLPRSLLDLVSRVSRGEEVSEKLRAFVQSLMAVCTEQVKFWHCFALAAQLELWESHPASEDDTLSIERDLAALLSELHLGSESLRVSALAWPAYTLGRVTQCPQTIQLVEDVLSGASQLYEIKGQWNGQGTPLGVMRTYWHNHGIQPQRKSAGHLVNTVFEVGLW
jgi:hypothetical protein